MAVPKRKTSRSNTRSRRANWKATRPTVVTCDRCREPYTPDVIPPVPASRNVVYTRGAGCAHCRHTGYQGRVGLFELLIVVTIISALMTMALPSYKQIQKRARASALVKAALSG